MSPAMSATALRKPPTKISSMMDRLNRFLPAYWLRPENALWMTLRSSALKDAAWAGPTLDACCGDGIFTFLHLGGKFDPSFDVYCGVDRNAVTARPQSDLYDAWNEDYRPQIAVRPTEMVDVGSDHKATLLAKAGRLEFYRKLMEHDHDLALPIAAESFQTIYCNAAYWMKDVESLLAEFRRLLRPGGSLILQVKLEAMRRHVPDSLRLPMGPKVLEILNGDRLECWPGLADRATWEGRFKRAALIVHDAKPFVTGAHALMWNIGLRPIAPLLMRMVAALNVDTRAAIKADWVELFTTLLSPMCRHDFAVYHGSGEPVEMQYVLRRS